MIRINLLPHREERRKRSAGSFGGARAASPSLGVA